MKTYSNILNRAVLTLVSSLLFCSINASASDLSNDLGVLPSNEAVELPGEMVSPPSNLQVTLLPFVYNGNVNIRCHGTNTGRATVEVTGGVPPYSYSWSSGFAMLGGTMAIGLYAGTVTVTVTDAVGNSASQSTTLTENPPLQAIANVSPILCNGGVATITLDATGGTMPYNGLSWYQFTAGTYSFTVADANGCRDEVITEIIEPPVLTATSTATAPILCHGGVTQVNVEAIGGVGPYSGTGIYNEGAGNSNYVITDANGCFAYTSIAINQPPPLEALVNSSDIACRGDLAEITVEANGGVSPYLGTGNFSVFQGNLTYTVIDANGCQASSSIQITQPPALVATISNSPIACNGDLAAVQVSASGGAGPYVGTGTYYESGGTHQYVVEDANGCWVEIATYIVEPREIEVDVSWTPIVNSLTTDVLVVADGGTPAYTGTGIFPTGPGTHVYTVYDANGCSGSEVITISNPTSTPLNSEVVISEQNNLIKTDGSQKSEVVGSYNASTKQIEMSYQLNYDSNVSIELYDMSGALVESIQADNTAYKDQYNTVSVDSGKFKSGMYMYHLVTNSERHAGKLHILH